MTGSGISDDFQRPIGNRALPDNRSRRVEPSGRDVRASVVLARKTRRAIQVLADWLPQLVCSWVRPGRNYPADTAAVAVPPCSQGGAQWIRESPVQILPVDKVLGPGIGLVGPHKVGEPAAQDQLRFGDRSVAEESRATVAVAFAANLLIAAAKLVGGLIGGSVAMLAEAAHSLADTVNQVFLFVSLTLGRVHRMRSIPSGTGRNGSSGPFWQQSSSSWPERCSRSSRVCTRFGPGGEESYLISYVVLGVAFCAECASLTKAVRQINGEARVEGRGFREHVRASKDPTLKVVLLEDSAAVVGIALGRHRHRPARAHRQPPLGRPRIDSDRTPVVLCRLPARTGTPRGSCSARQRCRKTRGHSRRGGVALPMWRRCSR